jgi:hypothetical protein
LSFACKWIEQNIILSEVSQAQKAKGHMFSLICGIQTQYKYKQYYIYMEIYTEHVSKVVLVEETKGGENKERKIENYKEIHHICVGTRHKETIGWGKE